MRLKNIINTLEEDQYPGNIIKQFEHVFENCSYNESIFEFVKLMDLLLTKEQRLSLWERNGDCRLGECNKTAISFRVDNIDKPISEKLKLLKNIDYLSNFSINSNGSITAESSCHLCVLKKLKKGEQPSPTLFGCSAGGAFYNYQIALGTKLKMKSIDIYPNIDQNRSPYSFTFEIIE